MKKNTTFIKLLLVSVTVLATAGSCKKSFLAEKIYSNFSPAELTDSLGFEAAIAGIQTSYNLWHMNTQDPPGNQGWLTVWQIGTDVAYNKAVADFDPLSVPYTNYAALTSSDESTSFTWTWAYNIINNCNVVITNLAKPDLQMGQANINSLKAEASFFRGLAYNTLATLYGGVPIITAPVTTPKTNFTRATIDSVNNLVIADLTFAESNLPTIENVKVNSKGKMYGRAHKAMASQLLAEVYLRTGQNDLAQQECDAVINSGDFQLVTSRYGIKTSQPGDPFSDMFVSGNQRRAEGNPEAIWVVEMENPNTIVGGAGPATDPMFPGYEFGLTQYRRIWDPRYYNQPGMLLCDSLGGRGISRIALTQWVLQDLYEQNDMRNSQYNLRRQFYYNDPTFPLYGQLVVPGPGIDTDRNIVPYTTKWNQMDPSNPTGGSVKDIFVMRFAETYLLKAEAQFKQGDLVGAATSLNVIRGRANASSIGASDVTMDFILDERARELIAEENRRMTLMRTQTLLTRVIGRGQNITGLSKTNLLLPIPLSEIQLNKDAVLDQNPGY
jgi:starch-binding outer membrane protein, SusD/RagB family